MGAALLCGQLCEARGKLCAGSRLDVRPPLQYSRGGSGAPPLLPRLPHVSSSLITGPQGLAC